MKEILRMTHQREIILEELGKFKGHPTADVLYERIKKKLPRISLATVYRNLEILSEAGMIRKLEISGRQKRFDRELERHSHVFCVLCHRVDDIMLDQCQMTPPGSGTDKGYAIIDCRVEFFGICPDCQKNERSRQQRSSAAPARNDGKEAQRKGALTVKQRKVLEHLKCDGICTGRDIASAVSLDPVQVSCQLAALKKKGFVASPARCQYKITDSGKNAL